MLILVVRLCLLMVLVLRRVWLAVLRVRRLGVKVLLLLNLRAWVMLGRSFRFLCDRLVVRRRWFISVVVCVMRDWRLVVLVVLRLVIGSLEVLAVYGGY